MNESQLLNCLISKVNAVRDAQRAYFSSRNDVNLRRSKAAESDLDAFLRKLKRRGYGGGGEERVGQGKLM